MTVRTTNRSCLSKIVYVLAAFALIAIASFGPSAVLAQSQKADTVIVTGKISVAANSNCVAKGALVYIPGRSFVAKLDADGQFALYQVPQAKLNYTLRIEIPNMKEGPLDVSLTAKPPMVDMGTINVPGSCTTGGGGGGGDSCSTKTCDDGNKCTADTCDTTTSQCVFTQNVFFPNASCDPATGGLGVCNAGFGDCDGNTTNGCEANIATSFGNCGACGHSCLLGQTCNAGACVTGP